MTFSCVSVRRVFLQRDTHVHKEEDSSQWNEVSLDCMRKKEIKNHHDRYHLQGVIHHFCSSLVSCSTSVWLQQIQLGSWPQTWGIMCFWWSLFKHRETELVIHAVGSLQQKHNSSAVEYFFHNLNTEFKRQQMKGLKQAADNAGGGVRAYTVNITMQNHRLGDTAAEQTLELWWLHSTETSKCESYSLLPKLTMP